MFAKIHFCQTRAGSTFISIVVLASALIVPVQSQAQTSWSLAPLAGFGVNGWLSGTAAFGASGTNGGIRSMAYNAATGNLLVANGSALQIVNGTSGVVGATLNSTGVTGGTRSLNTVTVTNDGVIYGSNLTTSSTTAGSSFKIYRWENETASPTTFYNGNGGLATGPRIGDSLTAFGNDATGRLFFGTGTTTTATPVYYSYLPTNGGVSGAAVAMSGTGAANQSFRQGIAIIDVDTVLGMSAGSFTNNALVSGNSAPWTFDALRTIANANERTISAVTTVFEGSIFSKALLATIQIGSTGTNTVRLYDASTITSSNLSSPLVTTNISLSNIANTNGTVGIAFGAVNGNPVLYAMNTNNGIQAFTVVPEPSTCAFLATGMGAAAGLIVRRRFRRRGGDRVAA